MIKKKVFDILQFPLPFELIKMDGKWIEGAYLSGTGVALAIRDRIYSNIQILCANDDAYGMCKQFDKQTIAFQPYTNVSNFHLNITIDVIQTSTPILHNGLNVCQVLATPSSIFATEESILSTNTVHCLNDNWTTKDLLRLHNAGLDINETITKLKGEKNAV